MKEIPRDRYLKKLIRLNNTDSVKIITGIRRCGKSYLLTQLFRKHLLHEGVAEANIHCISLESSKELRDPEKLRSFVMNSASTDGMHYIILDEIQLVTDFWEVVNRFRMEPNMDVYITGSNSRFLSSDIPSRFRGRSDEIHMYPLMFAEFLDGFDGTESEAWESYTAYGGLPGILSYTDNSDKESYLESLTTAVYVSDILERAIIRKPDVLNDIIRILSSSVGSLTNPQNIANTMRTNGTGISHETVCGYLDVLKQSFLFEKAERYDIKGRRYIGALAKYYAADIGIRNAELGFRQYELTHIMENMIYLELRSRGYAVDVGIVKEWRTMDGKRVLNSLEIDFVVNRGSRRYYIQSAYRADDLEKRERETRPFRKVEDGFRRILVVRDGIKPFFDDQGVLNIGIIRFLKDQDSLDLVP